jgi:ABC-type antimicrobial peptide transport system permease subunit
VIGRSLTLNGTSYTIVGIVPASFAFYGDDRDVYTPIGQWNDPSFRDRRISVSAHLIGRLKAGTALAQARADMDVVARNLATAFPIADKGAGITLISMKDDMVGNVRPALLILLGAVGFLLLIACANVANLLLARSMSRSREFAIRAALGAGRMRLVRQLLAESIVLASVGGVLGLLFAFGAVKVVLHTLPDTLPRAREIALDGRALTFTIILTFSAAITFGLVPALRGARTDLPRIWEREIGDPKLLAVAGAVNSIVGAEERLHVAAWHTKKKITKWEEEEGGRTIIHEREQFVHELAVAFADGRTAILE